MKLYQCPDCKLVRFCDGKSPTYCTWTQHFGRLGHRKVLLQEVPGQPWRGWFMPRDWLAPTELERYGYIAKGDD